MSEIVFLGEDEQQTARVFALGRRERILSLGGCAEGLIKKGELEARKRELADAKYAFCTWGMPEFTREEIARYLPSLKCVFYAAGSVQGFARGFLQSGVRVFSAACVNAVPVAETVFAQITLANKGFFHTLGSSSYAEKLNRALQFQGNFATTVGLVGLGAIGSMVAEKLKALSVRVIAYDKFANEEKYISLGAEKTDLYTLFAESDVVSNHLADNEETRDMLDYSLFSRMKENAVFINSGRSRQIVEADLARALEEERGRFAILDVTYPEPPEENSHLLSMENVLLTPHIDGSWGNEVVRMAKGEGLRIFSYGSYYSPTKQEDYLGEAEKIFETCRLLGCFRARIWAGEKWRSEATDEKFSEFAERMRRVGELAERYGVTACFEHHQNTFCDSGKHALEALEAIGRKNVRSYWQPIQPAERDNLDCIDLFKEYVETVHVYHWKGWDRYLLKEGKKSWEKYLDAFREEPREIPCLLEFTKDDSEENFFKDASCLLSMI